MQSSMKAILRPVRNEYGKRIRKDYENHRIRLPRSSIKKYEPRADGVSNTVTSVQKDNYLIEKNMDANLIMNLPEELKGKRLRIRKLTPRECFRLMGVREKEIDKIQQTKFLKNDVKPAVNQDYPNAKLSATHSSTRWLATRLSLTACSTSSETFSSASRKRTKTRCSDAIERFYGR